MNNQEKYKEDILKQYIDPERTEKAPEGFTSKVMYRVQAGAVPFKAKGRQGDISFVPVISIAVTVILLLAAVLIPVGNSDSLSLPAMKFINNIKVTLSEIDLSSIFRFDMPVILVYVFAGILILSILDIALFGLFHREK